MNTQKLNTSPRIKRETKNKIRVEFERTPFLERMKARFGTTYFAQRVVWYVFRFVLLLGISYVILFPFFAKISGSFMSPNDFVDVTVRLIPKYPTFDIYRAIFVEQQYMKAFMNTALLSVSTALIQTFICSVVGYGFAKFKFKGNTLLFLAVVLTMIIPHGTLQFALFMKFRYFDVFGLMRLISGQTLTLTNTFWPLILMSLFGLAFKNGLYIFMMRQFYRGVPDELEESAYVDGSGVFRTFIQIILPLSVPMMITIFLFSFSWQWTDDFYTTLFFTTTRTVLMPTIVGIPNSLQTNYAGQNLYYAAINSTCGLMIIAPLIIVYLFCQKFLVQGIERSGIIG
ncbi:MAG: carbohydrate ABC transporter permease [Clostridiales bacterium]|nr:carbohydrate ABC transporter permease [Clostridiales bacterium]